MESNAESEQQLMIEIDPKSARFPCCLVWTPLPVISWLVPFVGHIGICREDGVILDFAGPNFVSVDHFAFGAVARYLPITKEKCDEFPYNSEDEAGREILTWDDALRKSTQEFQHRSYNLLTCNCHSFVAHNLNRLRFSNGGWNVVNLAALIFIKGKWVSRASLLRSFLPFLIVCGLGLLLGGSTFLTFWACFTLFLVGWFVVATYFFKNLIQL
ncbi:hypothetical protein UlMin_039851 [Ulmus minor]